MDKPYIISVTGTKGKTTIVRLLDHVLRTLNKTTLVTDTDGHYLNGKMRGSMKDSLNLYGLVPTVSPGRFLYELKGKSNPVAILETAIGSSGRAGLGYSMHDIGVFTNLYDDHIGRRIKNRKDLAEHKARFIFNRIAPEGTAVFNADDRYICGQLDKIRAHRDIVLLPFGLDSTAFDIKKHLSNGGHFVTVEDNWVGVYRGKRFYKALDLNKIEWAFGGVFLPSVYNILCSFAVVYAYHGYKMPKRDILDSFYSYKLDKAGGRLTVFSGKKSGVRVLLDYAHEKYSLREIASLAKTISENKTSGVLRLAPDRLDTQIDDIAKAIANKFDHIVVYDKLDGVHRGRLVSKKIDLVREVGEVSGVLFEGLKKYRKKDSDSAIERILVEEKALMKAISIAKRGDVIVYIPNQGHKQAVKYIKKYLK